MASGIESREAKLFQNGSYEDAAQSYTDALASLPSTARTEEQIQLMYNRSSCYLKMKQYGLVVEDCSTVLALDPSNQKGFSRKVKALCTLGYYNEAHQTAQKWLDTNPESSQAKQEMERLQTVVDALDDQDEDPDVDLLLDDELISGERIPPEGREDENLVRSPSNILSTSTISSSNDKEGKSAGFYCEFCGITFQTRRELALHCRSDLHRKKVVSDEGHDWKYRTPPRGQTGDEFTMCPGFSEDGKCRFGNRCVKAHSDEELAEWKERFEFKKMRIQKAKEILLAGNSYSDQLMEKLMKAENPESVMVEKPDNPNLHCNTSLKITATSKRYTDSWMFTVTSRDTLQKLFLLDDQHSNLFHISSITIGPKKMQITQKVDDNCQEWTNVEPIERGPYALQKVYRIKVIFRTEIYGTFRQTIIFDFGIEPVLFKEVCVESAPVSSLDQLTKQICILMDAKRWDTTTIPLLEFKPKDQQFQQTDQNLKLLLQYPDPQTAKFTPSVAVISHSLTKENYRSRMHELLYIEEMAQYSSIARYNVKSSLHLVKKFLLIPGANPTVRNADNGELFARMKLNSELSEDTLHGRLILMNVFYVLLAPCSADKSEKSSDRDPKKIYEALVEDRGKDFLMMRLSAETVSDLKLKENTEIWLQVQFHVNRIPMCQMHLAIDKLPNAELLFPENCQAIPWTPKRQWTEQPDTKLNAKQKEALVAITTSSSIQLPPVLIVGPYGTGKTYTLAQAAKQILQQDNSRILICTHSNSAADLYIREYLHPYVLDGYESAKPLRVYYRHRRVDTVDHVVIQYCLVDSQAANKVYFKIPTKEDIEQHRIVVVTLSTSQYLYDLGLDKGFFTHILLDEAAQSMECETIMPIALAGPKTRVVLAGDHMQMSPEVHSDFVQERNLHISLLERLYDFYPSDNPVKILLCENYRSHKAIIDFTSELFYEDKLVTSGRQPRHEVFYPLTFFTARGEDKQHQNSTAFFNDAEVYEIVERVVELHKIWPKAWGQFCASSIGVVTPYSDQVGRIRAELRKKKLHMVSVERVFNVQGKQFRALFISTVRTRTTCSSDPSQEDRLDYGFLSNVKLLNTAITRAQSLVAVVGDPVSLCSIGKCRKLWERFLEICSQNNSLYGITWNQLRSQLDGVEMKKTYTLNPLAPEFVPNRIRHPVPGDVMHMEHAMPHMIPTSSPYRINPHWPQFYPQLQVPFWPHGQHQMLMPGYPHQLIPPMMGPYLHHPGSGPPSPVKGKDGKAAVGNKGPVSPVGSASREGVPGKGVAQKQVISTAGVPFHPAMFGMQARGAPIMMPGAGPPPLRGVMGPPGWPHAYVGQPITTRVPYSQVSPPHMHSVSGTTPGKAIVSETSKATSRPQIQILPNVRHAPPHLMDQQIKLSIPDDAMLSQNPHLQREFYSYIMRRDSVDAANSFLNNVQQRGQQGQSRCSPGTHAPPSQSSFRHSQQPSWFSQPASQVKTAQKPSERSPNNDSNKAQQLEPSVSKFFSTFKQADQNTPALHGNNELNPRNVDFTVPSDLDRIVKIMEESATADNRRSPFGAVNPAQPGPPPGGHPEDLSPQQRRLPPLYMRGPETATTGMETQEQTSPKPMSYAAALQKKAQAPARQERGDSSKDDMPDDPLDLLKNLNIKASPGTQALYQYFS